MSYCSIIVEQRTPQRYWLCSNHLLTNCFHISHVTLCLTSTVLIGFAGYQGHIVAMIDLRIVKAWWVSLEL